MRTFSKIFLVTSFCLSFCFSRAACPSGSVYISHQSDAANYASNGGCSVISGDLWITDAGDGPDNQVYDLSGLSMITEVQGYVYIVNSSLKSLVGLGNLTRIALVLTIQSNPSLESLEGLNALKIVDYILIGDNPALKDLIVLTGISTLTGLNIRNNASLASLKGFEGLTTIYPVGIDIQDNPLLESLDGLQNVATLPIIRIENNRNLSSISLLNKIKSGVQQVYIKNNPELITCDPVCTFLAIQATNGGITEISNNGAKCQSVEQMEQYCDDPLPIVLASFSVQQEEHIVKLRWITAHETNSRAFVIQHSINGISWNEIGSVLAMSESNRATNYEFTHGNPSSKNYYRIKLEDNDNSFAYSSIKVVTLSEIQSFASVYPNPASEYLTINPVILKQIKQISIYNNVGAKIFESQFLIEPIISVKHLKSGLYSVKIVDKTNSKTIQRLAIVR